MDLRAEKSKLSPVKIILNTLSDHENGLMTMNRILKTGLMLMLTVLTLSCASPGHNPYGDPDAQRDRAKQAQDELHRDTSK